MHFVDVDVDVHDIDDSLQEMCEKERKVSTLEWCTLRSFPFGQLIQPERILAKLLQLTLCTNVRVHELRIQSLDHEHIQSMSLKAIDMRRNYQIPMMDINPSSKKCNESKE